ncbi:aldo/keto reductase [Flavobacterium sp. 1355]|uniref:aldo/keto reductase n=1 Tax=Flavobacterium sp. 1355 TaxID=2806571 RepID=UPI001AE27E94|nr:aldo/keto reductase [Flavobacterium sp. 1355]MBP1223836.1 aryl-alcohol dehydrogenase-like predicted oxidoreductase [Flavobacterium sp. 1355]
MKYKIFGQKSGLRVSELALGTGNFGTRWGHGSDAATSKQVFETYINAGGNFIDTADGYQLGESEELLGGFIKGKRQDLVLSSKFSTGGKTLLTTGNSRKNIIHSVEASLKRLNTDYIDLYWAHISDGQTPIEEMMRALDDLVRSGKILYTGFSNYPAWRIANASLLADLRGWAPVVGIQTEYNLIERTADRELLPMAEALGLGVAFWSPLAGGTLTGKYRAPIQDSNSRQQAWGGALLKGETSDRETKIIDTLEEIAKENDAKILEISLAWLRQKNDKNALSAITILGPRNEQQLLDNLSSLNVTLSDEQINRLNEASKIVLGSPYEIIESSQNSIFGAGSDLVETKHTVR